MYALYDVCLKTDALSLASEVYMVNIWVIVKGGDTVSDDVTVRMYCALLLVQSAHGHHLVVTFIVCQ